MPIHLKKFQFDQEMPINYVDDEPFALNNDLNFFHNKNKFRKELNSLQYLFQEYTGTPLLAPGIRDSYLSEELSEKFFIVLFTDNEVVTGAEGIISKHQNVELNTSCFYLESTSNYMLLLSKDFEGLVSGINLMLSIFKQVFEDYLQKEDFEDFVRIQPFTLVNCKK